MEDFVPFELAVKLRDKGFDEECLAYYTSEYTLYTNKVVLCDDKYLEVAEIDYEECLRSYNTQKDRLLRTIVDAPTISQVLKWLREEKKVHIIAEIADRGWYNTIYPNVRWENGKLKSDTYIMSFKNKESYEQAALAGIEYALDNLI